MSEEKSVEELVVDAFTAQQIINGSVNRRIDGLLKLICSLHNVDLEKLRAMLEEQG